MAAAAAAADSDDVQFLGAKRSLCTGSISQNPDEKSRNLHDHYECVQFFTNLRGYSLFVYRWFEEHEYTILKEDRLYHKDRLSRAQRRHLEVCPLPRLTSLNGGNYHFPYSERDEMLRRLALDIEEGSPMYWNQIAFDKEGEGARLVVDIDSEGRVVDDTDICRISRVLWQTLKEYFPKDFDQTPIDIFVSKCGPRIKKGKMCTGIHLVCHVKVSFDQARQLIHGYKLRLDKEPGMDMTGLTVDAGIYKENSKQVSIRMIYSRKIEDCPLCGGPKQERVYSCTFCDRRGRVATKKTYEPLCCIRPDTGRDDPDYFAQKAPDFVSLVKCYSIWPEARDAAHEFIKPPGDPVYDLPTKSKKLKPVGAGTKHMKKIKSSDPVYEMVEDFIRSIVWEGKKLWERVDVDNISLTENQRLAWISISGLDSSQCPYAMKDHGGNRIFFVLTRAGQLQVKCRSEKAEYGCQTKDKIQFSLPGTVVQQVFGLAGPGNVIRYSSQASAASREHKSLGFVEFTKRQSKDAYTLERRRVDEQEYQRQKRLKYISDGYRLEKKLDGAQ